MNAPDLDIDPTTFDDVPDGIEPEAAEAQAAVDDFATAMAAPALAIAEVLPADFPLPALVRWVPDVALKTRLDRAVTIANNVDVAAEDGLDAADVAMAEVRGIVKAIEADFDEPKRIAHDLHKSITSRLGEWVAPAKAAIDKVGRAVAAEHRRRDEIAARIRREAQQKADADARKRAEAAATAAAAQGAPAAVVEQMQQQAAVATAPPVPLAPIAPAPLAHSTVTKTWKARIAGTPADDAPNPAMADLTPPQQAAVLTLMKDVIAGGTPLAAFEINWSLLNARAKSEKGTLSIPGIEAFEELSTRAKASRRL